MAFLYPWLRKSCSRCLSQLNGQHRECSAQKGSSSILFEELFSSKLDQFEWESVKSSNDWAGCQYGRLLHTSENIPIPDKPSARKMHVLDTEEMLYNPADPNLFMPLFWWSRWSQYTSTKSKMNGNMSGYCYIFHKAEMFHLARLQESENPKLASYFYILIRRLLE